MHCPGHLLVDDDSTHVHVQAAAARGRTARAGASGKAVSFCSDVEMGELKGILKVLKIDIPVASGKQWAGAEIKAKPKQQQGRGGRRPQSSGRRPQRRAA